MGTSCITRICAHCTHDIAIDTRTLDEVVYWNKKTYHANCFIEQISLGLVGRLKTTRDTWASVQSNMEQIRLSTRQHFLDMIQKDNLYEWMRNHYDITVVPSSVWTRLIEIHNGTYKGMSEGISPDVLLDMLERKKEYLNKVYMQNIAKGKQYRNVAQRIIYDLAIMVNKYDGYKTWLEKQKILAADIECNHNTTDSPRLTELVVRHSAPAPLNPDDLEDLVDDIFAR